VKDFKVCTKCGVTKLREEFNKDGKAVDGLNWWCRQCANAASRAWAEANPERVKARSRAWAAANSELARTRSRAWYKANPERVKARSAAWEKANPERVRARHKVWVKANPEKVKAYGRRFNYGVTPEEHAAMLKQQNGLCAICGKRPATCVDHCHATEKVRGLLCRKCNTGIGQLEDSVDNLKRAIGYLVRTEHEI
jgi:hypothetical protein